MTDESESGRRGRTHPRLIRPSEHLAMVEQAREQARGLSRDQGRERRQSEGRDRRPVHLVPSVTVVQGPRPPPPPGPRPYMPAPVRMPAPIKSVPPPVTRIPQPRRDVQVPNDLTSAFDRPFDCFANSSVPTANSLFIERDRLSSFYYSAIVC
ncbi:unnamed protein product [Danaus chrysippus]|uniref:(African queen) hypothetical protein n=1 Tax=Danaus chrysippus TaxID=151541 RepID=A0A8J2REZ9_9NEOP|nr:unnamed protein product [Danaus chrysippus]